MLVEQINPTQRQSIRSTSGQSSKSLDVEAMHTGRSSPDKIAERTGPSTKFPGAERSASQRYKEISILRNS